MYQKKEINKSAAIYIKNLRPKGVSVFEAGEAIGLSGIMITRYENGETYLPKDRFIKLKQFYESKIKEDVVRIAPNLDAYTSHKDLMLELEKSAMKFYDEKGY